MIPRTPAADAFNVPPMSYVSSAGASRTASSLNYSFDFGPRNMAHSRESSFNLDPSRSILHVSPAMSSPRKKRKPNGAPSERHPLAHDTTDVFTDQRRHDQSADAETEEDEEEEEWSMIDRMRLWRHDALMQHLYETAAFWGDKIVTWTNDPNDAFWLAQTYFMTHQFSRAEKLLTRPFPITSGEILSARTNGVPPTSHFPATSTAGARAKGKMREVLQPGPSDWVGTTAMPNDIRGGHIPNNQPVLGMHIAMSMGLGLHMDNAHVVRSSRLPVGAGAMIEVAATHDEDDVGRLIDMSVACRYLAAQCQVRQGKWHDALETLGEDNPFRTSDQSGNSSQNMDGGIKIEASMCHLRGILMMKLGRGDQAKKCFMEALALDVKCYESFDQLVSGEMMTPEEEWEFVQGLAYTQQAPEDADFVRLIYTSRLKKFKHTEEHTIARRRLAEDYSLSDNPDLLFSFADALYAQFRWADCFAITSRILGLVSVHAPTMPVHLACMYHLNHLHSKLFILAHELVDKEPESALSWYAVGMWYVSQKKWPEARQYFSKTSLMDPRFGPAWIAFAHTFAHEGEHDHAITAYSTCVRMFPGSHLPLVFMGMEHIILANHAQAEEAFGAAHAICDGDPLLCNERGVMAHNRGDYEQAAELFAEALKLAEVIQGSGMAAWASTYINLGTCYRKLGRYTEAIATYQRVLQVTPQNAMALASLGLVNHLSGDLDGAILKYHEALSIHTSPNVLDLLQLALEDNMAPERMLKPVQSGAKTPTWVQNLPIAVNTGSKEGTLPVM